MENSRDDKKLELEILRKFKVDTILELKIMRRLLEVLSMTGFVAAFDEFHVQEFLKGDGFGEDEEDDAPFNLAFVMATMNRLVDDCCKTSTKEQEAYEKFYGACLFVAAKREHEELKDITRELKANPLYDVNFNAQKHSYTYFILARLLKMIDLALKDVDA